MAFLESSKFLPDPEDLSASLGLPPELTQESIHPSKLSGKSDSHFLCTRDLLLWLEKRFLHLGAEFHVRGVWVWGAVWMMRRERSKVLP